MALAAALLSGLIATLPDLDEDLLLERSPYSHSILYAIILVILVDWFVLAIRYAGLLSRTDAMALILSFAIALFSHLTLDAATKEGIFTFPKRDLVESRGKKWSHWSKVSIALPGGLRKEDDPLLNSCVSAGSLATILFLLALVPAG